MTTNQLHQQAWQFRQIGLSWAEIAMRLGFRGESGARTAANRYAESQGFAHDYVHPPQAGRRKNRTFGTELEFIDAKRDDVAVAIEQALASLGSAQTHVAVVEYHGKTCIRRNCNCGGIRINGKKEWRVERDGSVSNGEHGGEIVSPILRGKEGLKVLTAVIKHAKMVDDIAVDRRCGLHVHLGTSDMTGLQRANVVRQWWKHQIETIDPMIVKRRRNRENQYCFRPSDDEFNNWIQAIERSGRGAGYQERTRSLNVTSFPKYGTLEVRQHEGSLNATKVCAWVQFLVAFFDHAKAMEHDEVPVGLAALDALQQLGRIDVETVTYLKQRTVALA